MNLILFGPPGCGKGTQAARLKDKYQLKHISTGDLLREEKAKESPLGLEAKKYMDQGMLVPDEVVIGMIDSCLDEYSKIVKGFLFDGFPRTTAQALALDELFINRGLDIDLVLSLEVSEEEIVKRILKRGETSGRADDNDEETIRKRFSIYKESTAPLADFYDQQDKLSTLNGEGDIDDITIALCASIDNSNKSQEEE